MCYSFYYPINLHYSQTTTATATVIVEFYYPINLHYSQTGELWIAVIKQFYYPINLHYSQTVYVAEGKENSFTTL